MRTHATFRSDRFARPPDNPMLDSVAGADLAGWLADELSSHRSLSVGAPSQADWSWQVPVAVGAQRVVLIVGLVSPESPEWCVSVAPAPALDSALGGRLDQTTFAAVVRFVHDTLRRAAGIRELGWHDEAAFNRGVFAPSSSPFDAPGDFA